jgi:hypothetical protein
MLNNSLRQATSDKFDALAYRFSISTRIETAENRASFVPRQISCKGFQ